MTPVASAMQAPTIEGVSGEKALSQLRPLDGYPHRRARPSPRARVFEGDMGCPDVGSKLRVRPRTQDEGEDSTEGADEVQRDVGS
jgi:hypothetical protein